ncbi:MAG: FprA family A-type flavoprotein [Desulfovibrionaceae bacterium]
MKPIEIKKDIYWVGHVDWSSRDFHGYSLSPRGTTYNAYLVKDEKITLFDSVKAEAVNTLKCRIAQVCDLSDIDYIVIDHVEQDHAGAMPAIIEAAKPEKIFTSPMGLRTIKAVFGDVDWPIEVVKTGDSVSIGTRTIQFMEMRMVHWPDSMASYIPEDKLLIPNDAFGQNIASSERFVDEFNRAEVFRSMQEYYANIVLPYSPQVLKVLEQVAELGLDIDMIAPDHGLIFRGKEDCQYALDTYKAFAEQKAVKPKAVVVYDTMWHSTEKMAKAITEGLEREGISVRCMWLKANHHSAVMTEIFDAAAVIVGSPTHNNGIMPNVAAMLTYMKGLRPQNKIGAAFGSFGWSGESVKAITEWLEAMHLDIVAEPVKCQHVPGHDVLGQCAALGHAVGQAIKAKITA